MKKLLIAIPFLFLAAACNKQTAQVQPAQNQQPVNYDECIKAGGQRMGNLQIPEQCQLNGKTFYSTAPKEPQTEAQQQPQATSADETANWKIYTGHGFQLTFTDAWKGYKVFSSEGSQGVGAPDYIDFSMPTSDKTQCVQNVTDEVCGYAQIFEITIIAKDRNYQGTGVKITQDNDNAYYYSISISNNLPDDLQRINFEAPKVISTFKFIK